MKKTIVLLLSAVMLLANAEAKKAANKAPVMGWASWNQFGVKISDEVIKGQADAMATSGLKAAGFKYINIDDGFFDGRNEDGSLRLNKTKFPNGFKPLVDYIHSLGLKAGYYSEAGESTCGSIHSGQPGGINGGLYNHDQQDCDSVFSKWGFDFIKVDYCGGQKQKLDEETRYTEIRKAIDNTGRKDEINYNICRWQFPGTWCTTVADSWRMSGDINYTPGSKARWSSIAGIINQNKYLAPYASPGHYNDMDMLEVGRGLTFEEDKSHFSMWCILSSPLLLGHDMTKMSEETKSILTNPEVISVNQDPYGLQAQLIYDKDSIQIWAKHLNGRQSKEYAVALLNLGRGTNTLTVNWKDLNIVGSATVRDLWKRADLGKMESGYTVTLPSHNVSLIMIKAGKTTLKETFEGEYGWLQNFNKVKNNVLVPGQAKAVVDANCSGRAKATSLGKDADNYIEFRDVYSKSKGSYTLTLHYLCADKRNTTLTVNGVNTEISDLSSGDAKTVATVSVPVNLKKGYNIIRFSNATTAMPDVDKIAINLNK